MTHRYISDATWDNFIGVTLLLLLLLLLLPLFWCCSDIEVDPISISVPPLPPSTKLPSSASNKDCCNKPLIPESGCRSHDTISDFFHRFNIGLCFFGFECGDCFGEGGDCDDGDGSKDGIVVKLEL